MENIAPIYESYLYNFVIDKKFVWNISNEIHGNTDTTFKILGMLSKCFWNSSLEFVLNLKLIFLEWSSLPDDLRAKQWKTTNIKGQHDRRVWRDFSIVIQKF